MARDASSGNGEYAPQTKHETQPAPQPMPGVSNLTQELAHLLAASIAQNQAARGQPPGAPTGADLASLASLVAGAQNNRKLSVGFRDGLASLSYAPLQPQSESFTVAELGEMRHDDEPMPIPSTWRRPEPADEDRWFRKQMGAAALGLLAGLLIVVPAVLWLSGWLPTQRGKTPTSGMVTASISQTSEPRTVKVQVRPLERPSEITAPPVQTEPPTSQEARQPADRLVPTITASSMVKAPQPAPDNRGRAEETLALAKARIDSGDVVGARQMLVAAESTGQGTVWFALAETYDPNMLAAWGVRGVAADVPRARALYGKALDNGVGRAMVRLDALR